MAVAAADGALGIEARHQWIDIEAAAVLATLGKIRDDDTGELVWPHYKITDIAGLFDFPEIEDNSEPKTEAIGVIPYPGRARAKNVTYTVEARGQTLQQMRAAGAALRAGFGPDINSGLALERLMVITPHPAYGEQEHAFRAKCLQMSQGSDKQERSATASPTPFVRTVVIGLRLYDPRIYQYGEAEGALGVGHPKW